MSMLACAIASLGPVLGATRASAIATGKERRVDEPPSRTFRSFLLAAQIALSTVLLVGAGLLTRAISHAMSLDPGFAIGAVQETSIELPRGASADALPRIRETLAAAGLPPLAFSSLRPITTAKMEIAVRYSGQEADKGRRLTLRPVSANYFAVLGIPFVKGQSFEDRGDSSDLVISESAARLLWPNEDPIGKRLVTGSGDSPPQSREIVGLVADVPTTTLDAVEPVIYTLVRAGSVVLARDLSPAQSARLTALVHSAVPGAAAYTRPLVDEMRDSLQGLVIGGRIAWVVGLLALVLAVLGAFGVFASTAEERRREIGVRMALGAGGRQVVQLVLFGAARPVLGGLAAGVGLSLIVMPLLRSALYGMSPFDPIAYLEICGILLASSLAATWIPAARAVAVEPAITLRGE
jgi:hypothetical protein